MSFKYNPLSGQIEDQRQGPQGPAGTMTSSAGGTAGTPGFNFDGDTDTGFYSIGANTLGISTGGTQRVEISSAGRVGIGAGNPQTPIHVKLVGTDTPIFGGGSSSDSVIRLEDLGNNNSRYHGIDLRCKQNGDVRLYAHDRGDNKADFVLFLDNLGISERLRVTYDGKIGIGTSVPSRELTIHSSDSGSTYINLTNSTTGNGAQDGFGIGLSGDEEAKIWNFQNTSLLLGTNNQERVVITNDGKVGINIPSGETPDATALDATGDVTDDYNAAQDHRGKAQLVARNSTAGSNKFSSIGLVTGGGVQAAASLNLVHSGTDYQGHLTIKQRAGSSSTAWHERLRIDKDGNIGIGTTTPNSPLVIKGPSNGQFEFQLDNENSVNKILSINRVANVYREFHYDGASHDFEIQGTSKLEITSTGNVLVKDGNVGIGNDSPYSNASFNSLTIGKTKKGLIELKDENNVAKAHLYENNGDFNVSTVGSAGSIKLITGDTATRLTIDADGDIGVSTSTISKQYGRQIQIHDDGIGSPYGSAIHLTNSISGTSGTDGYHTVFQNNHLYHWLRESGDQIFATSGSQKMVIKSDGKVGIGESSPTAPLHVSAVSQNNNYGLIQGKTTSNNSRAQLHLTGRTFGGTEVKIVLGGDGDSSTGNLFTKTNHPLGFATNNAAPQMVLDTSGKFGIGTDSPNDDLEISSTVPTIRLTDSDGGPCYHQIKGPGNGDLRISCDVGNSSNSNSEIQFDIHDSTKMVIQSDGKVGIGTTTPNEILQVNQAGAVQTIIGSTNGGGAWLILDGDSNGDGIGSDYSSIVHNSDGLVLTNRKTTPIIFKNMIGGSETEALRISDGDTKLPDDKYLKFGASNDLTIRHASGNNYINSQNGSLYIQTGGNTALEIKDDKSSIFSGPIQVSSISYPETTELLTEFKGGVNNSNRYKNRYIKIRQTYTGSGQGGIPIVWEANADGSNNKSYGAITIDSDGDLVFSNKAAAAVVDVGTDLGLTEQLRIEKTTGDATFTGNIKCASGKGVNFSLSGTGGGSTSSTLDDYEEGTFTPAAVSPATGTIANTGSCYTKIGRLVIATYHIGISSGNASPAKISLPFTAGGKTNSAVGGIVTEHNVGDVAITAAVDNTSFLRFIEKGGNGTRYWMDAFNGKELRFTVWYMTE